MSLKYTEEYYPDLADIPADVIAAERAAVVNALKDVMPDVDMNPGTPTGDFVITPLAVFRAAENIANSHFMSDLDLANVADGLIYSCDFVRAYLGNFSVYDVDNLRATGLVRLTYKTADARNLPTSIRFKFGTDDVYSLKMSGSDATDMRILAAGSSHDLNADSYILTQTSATTWSVDVPVETIMTAPVLSGTEGTATIIDDELVGIVASITFLTGLPSASLSDLAAMARKIAVSLTGGSKSSFKTLMLRHWPETKMVSPILTGDDEMQRATPGAAMALQQPAVDVYFRSARDMQLESQIIKLEYVLPAGSATKVFRGKCGFSHRPSLINSVLWSGTTDVNLVDSAYFYSQPKREDLYGSLHCGTRYEDLFLEVVPFVDGSGTSLVPLTDEIVNGVTTQYALFEVEYRADPLLETVSSLLESPEHKPVGVDVLVKSGPLANITGLTVRYTKQSGVNTLLNVARQRISAYMMGAGYPTPFTAAAIHDIMRSAGVSATTGITYSGSISVTPAHRIVTQPTLNLDSADKLGDWTAASEASSSIEITGVEDLTDSHTISEVFDGSESLNAWASTPRTLRYYLEEQNIKFVEV